MPSLDVIFHFGDFEFDVAAYRLRHEGRTLKLERLPMELLALLLENHGRLVHRDHIAARLWGDGAFTDVETGMNIAVRKVRRALGDTWQSPAFVETVVGMGYRFIAPVTTATRAAHAADVRPVTLAVLPVANLTGDPGHEYLADGLTEEVISTVGGLDPCRLLVVGRQSVMRYKRSVQSLAEIGHELNCDHVIESSLRANAGVARFAFRLIRLSDQCQIWSEVYDCACQDILGLQRELSAAVAKGVRAQLTPGNSILHAQRHSLENEAVDAYLRGRYSAKQRTETAVTRALDCFRHATTLDPAYALAWAGMADAYASQPVNSDVAPQAVARLARVAAEQAAAAGPELPETQVALGRVRFWFDWDWRTARTAFLHAIALNGNHAEAYRMLGHLDSQCRRHAAAQEALERAQALDPLNAMIAATQAQGAYQARNFEAAREYAERAILLDGDFWIAQLQAAQAFDGMGDSQRALDALNEAGARSDNNCKVMSLKGYILARSGRVDEARRVLAILESAAQCRYMPPVALALVHAGLGNENAMFEWLDHAARVRDVHLIFVPVDPKWQPYLNDARFQRLTARFTELVAG
jgi:TolB-like protein/Tfp pilus assembly protein PilF